MYYVWRLVFITRDGDEDACEEEEEKKVEHKRCHSSKHGI